MNIKLNYKKLIFAAILWILFENILNRSISFLFPEYFVTCVGLAMWCGFQENLKLQLIGNVIFIVMLSILFRNERQYYNKFFNILICSLGYLLIINWLILFISSSTGNKIVVLVVFISINAAHLILVSLASLDYKEMVARLYK